MTEVSLGKIQCLISKAISTIGHLVGPCFRRTCVCSGIAWQNLFIFLFFSCGRLINADACTLPSIIKHVTLIAQSHFALLSMSGFYIYLGKIM